MKNIILLCAAGMSTSLLVQKIRDAAEKRNYECTVNAYAIAEAESLKDQADIMLLGQKCTGSMPGRSSTYYRYCCIWPDERRKST